MYRYLIQANPNILIKPQVETTSTHDNVVGLYVIDYYYNLHYIYTYLVRN